LSVTVSISLLGCGSSSDHDIGHDWYYGLTKFNFDIIMWHFSTSNPILKIVTMIEIEDSK
jgi:hypothetical protein